MEETEKPKEEPTLNPIERQEAVLKGMREENDRYEKLVKDNQQATADAMLAGSVGGAVEAPVVSEDEAKKKGAAEFFEGTALGDAINDG